MKRHLIIASLSTALTLGGVLTGTISSHAQKAASSTICPVTTTSMVARASSLSIVLPQPQPCPSPLPWT